ADAVHAHLNLTGVDPPGADRPKLDLAKADGYEVDLVSGHRVGLQLRAADAPRGQLAGGVANSSERHEQRHRRDRQRRRRPAERQMLFHEYLQCWFAPACGLLW